MDKPIDYESMIEGSSPSQKTFAELGELADQK